MKLSLGAA